MVGVGVLSTFRGILHSALCQSTRAFHSSSKHELASLGSVLVANRGEIACRVLKTARQLGLPTIAVFSDADRGSMHVEMADTAVHIGPSAPTESYLNIDRIIDTACRVGASSIHPGYGFLSENEAFVRRCEAAGLVFVGPPASAIASMGNKTAAKNIMQAAGVPVVPGYHGSQLTPEGFAEEAQRIGFPVLIKAELGGGGKGMKIATSAHDFPDALQSAMREAKAAFNDDKMLLEKLIQRPRHIEVQVMADKHGQCLYLFERDCSVQRRHQKIIEEAPAPGLSEAKRRQIGEAAVAAAQAVHYVGAGTVEFIVDTVTEEFFFMEMNTRLQVEHPVTELVSGMDLVEMQLRVAANQPLPLIQQQLKRYGHAFEARIYAEQPYKSFLPSGGSICHWQAPAGSYSFGLDRTSVRLDSAMRVGEVVGVHYDPMIAKLITWGEDRAEALQRLRDALPKLQIGGPPTNIDFLQKLTKHPAFIAAELDTGFIERHSQELLTVNPVSSRGVAVAFIARILLNMHDEATSQRAHHGPSTLPDPWTACDGYRMGYNLTQHLVMNVQRGAQTQELTADVTFHGPGAFEVTVDDITHNVTATLDGSQLQLIIDGLCDTASACSFRRGSVVHLDLWLGPRHCHFVWPETAWTDSSEGSDNGSQIVSPMTATVCKVNATSGEQVKQGTVLVVVKAMKMEHALLAPSDAVVNTVLVTEGQLVQDSDLLVLLDINEEEA